MKDYEEMQKAIKAFEEMSPEYRRATLLKMLHDQTINMADAIKSYGTYLEQYKKDAMHDIYKLSVCGLDLAADKIKRIPKMADTPARAVAIAQSESLLNAGGYSGSKFGDELRSYVDISKMDKKWYEQCWALKNPLVNRDGQGER